MRRVLFALLLLATPAFATISVKPNADDAKKIDVAIVDEPLSKAVDAVHMYLPHTKVQIIVNGDPHVKFSAKRVDPEGALHAIALSAGVTLTKDEDQYWLRSGPSVTIDVKDEDVQTILKSMQKQCGIKNLVIDKDVQGKATFMFDAVPCRTAFDIVFRTFGLASVDYGNSVVTVGARRR